jgi:WD40 repeat protein
LSQSISDPPEEKLATSATPVGVPVRPTHTVHTRLSGIGVVALLVLIGLSLLLFSSQILLNLNQVWTDTAPVSALARQVQASPSAQHSSSPTPVQGVQPTPTLVPTPTAVTPFFTPNNALTPVPALQLPANHYVLYQNATHIYLVSTTDGTTTSLYTPSYAYNQALPPVLTPTGQLIYSGSAGIWLTDIFDQQPVQIAQITPDMAITSLALSQDGTMLAWSTAPLDGNGQISLYAGSLTTPQLVWQHSALDCPCFRIFSFLNGTTSAADTTLLLTDDLGSSEAVQYGLWSLDISTSGSQPQIIMDENPQPQQGPLAIAPYSNVLLYSPNEQVVPVPTDNSIPADVAALSYPNSLSMASLNGVPLTVGTPQEALAGQSQKANNALNRWVTTPTFSPDGQTLAYIEFSSDSQAPYDRHSALYTIQVSGSAANLQVSHPQLVASSTSRLLELGPWLNSHVVTLYGDSALYALDVQSGALTIVSRTGGYARILAVVGTGQT